MQIKSVAQLGENLIFLLLSKNIFSRTLKTHIYSVRKCLKISFYTENISNQPLYERAKASRVLINQLKNPLKFYQIMIFLINFKRQNHA